MGEVKRQKVLILDMDETMLHARILTSDSATDADWTVPLQSASNPDDKCFIAVKVRPYLFQCLEHLGKMYEIVVFTAGEQSYADAILDQIDPEGQII